MNTLVVKSTADGWTDETPDKEQDFWTSVNAATALVRAGMPLEAVEATVERALRRIPEVAAHGGFIAVGNSRAASLALTADVGRLLLYSNEFSGLNTIVDAIIASQHTDGSWGISPIDTIGRTRSTAQALRLLMEYRYSVRNTSADAALNNGVRWLLSVRMPAGSLWANTPGDEHTNLSASTWAVYALAKFSRIGMSESGRARQMASESFSKLAMLGRRDNWIGTREDTVVSFSVGRSRRIEERLGSGAVGLTLAVPAIAFLMARSGPSQSMDYESRKILMAFWKRLRSSQGGLMTYSEDNSSTFTWYTAFAVEAVTETSDACQIQLSPKMLAHGALGYMDRGGFAVGRQLAGFVTWSGWIILALLGLRALIGYLGSLPNWYGRLSPFGQGAVMALIGGVITAVPTLVRLSWRTLTSGSRRTAASDGSDG